MIPGNLSDDAVLTGTNNTPAERVAASRTVLRHARSREDLHQLLDALGLNRPAESRKEAA